jgi:hypothetical protein
LKKLIRFLWLLRGSISAIERFQNGPNRAIRPFAVLSEKPLLPLSPISCHAPSLSKLDAARMPHALIKFFLSLFAPVRGGPVPNKHALAQAFAERTLRERDLLAAP